MQKAELALLLRRYLVSGCAGDCLVVAIIRYFCQPQIFRVVKMGEIIFAMTIVSLCGPAERRFDLHLPEVGLADVDSPRGDECPLGLSLGHGYLTMVSEIQLL